jgi:hypothetical protein
MIYIPEERWYFQKRTTHKSYIAKGLSLSRGYAPFPVFVESDVDDEVVEYAWDFGDGSETRYGYTSAHVYEKPGTYVITCTTTDTSYIVKQYTLEVTVLVPDGKIYYVDSTLGDDANDGLSPDRAWKTATKAFSGMNTQFYKVGDQVLFKRGLVYDLIPGVVKPGHYKTNEGYSFSTYGTGTKPVIRRSVPSPENMLFFQGYDANHIGFVDLIFDSTTNVIGNIQATQGRSVNQLFLRCEFYNGKQLIGWNNGGLVNNISGAFVFNCVGSCPDEKILMNGSVQVFVHCGNFAMVNSSFTQSPNHNVYGSFIKKGVFFKNVLGKQAFGCHALRISGASKTFRIPANKITIYGNLMEGHQDPLNDTGRHNGKGRWNALMLQIGSQTHVDQSIENVWIENNIIRGGETLLELSSVENVRCFKNTFETSSPYQSAARIQIGGNGFERRPSKNIYIYNNVFNTAEKRNQGSGYLFRICSYTKPAYLGESKHTGLFIVNNTINITDGSDPRVFHIEDSTDLPHIYFQNNSVTASVIAQVGGTYNVPGVNVSEWSGGYPTVNLEKVCSTL